MTVALMLVIVVIHPAHHHLGVRKIAEMLTDCE